ncbi:MAG: glycosyltransferase, partial [Acidimicrobiia bacterium]|nr:glycosyltransferase [Acidimicrobiia bacterium]
MSRARWLVLGSHVPAEGGLGGMIRYTVEVTRALGDRDDVTVHAHCQPGAVPFFVDELGVAPERVHATARGSTVPDSMWEVAAAGTLAERLGADVVFGSKQLIPWRSGGARRVLTVHDMLPMDRPSDFGPLKRLLLPPAYRRSIRSADVLACVSGAARGRLCRHVPEAAAKAIVVPNAMTGALSMAEPVAIPELIDRRFALVVGDRSRRKNAGFVVDLWSDVVALVPDAHLVLVGPPG